MDNIRLLLILSLGAVLFLIYQAWVQDYGMPEQQPVPQAETSAPEPASTADTVPSDAPDAPPPVPAAEAVGQSSTVADAGPAAQDREPIVVETDLIRAEISRIGGTIDSLWLKDYAQTAKQPDVDFRLLKPVPPNMFIVQSGLLGGEGVDLPTHKSPFEAAKASYSLAEGKDSVTVEMHWSGDAGIEVIKRYRFERGSYVIQAEQEIVNNSTAAVALRDYAQLQRTDYHNPEQPRFVKTYTGAAYYGPETKYKKESFDEITKQPLDSQVMDGWIAMMQHYFMAAWIPPKGTEETFYTKTVDGDRYIIGMYSPTVTVTPGATHTFTSRLFAGPKLQDKLAQITPGLELAVDYGWLTIIAEPIFWLLEKIHWLVGNWGWSIIILTVLIKLAFYKLSETSYKSMANMRELAPRLQALKDRYGDDKERLNQAMMEMYKTEKINPLGGCLPILVQIPVFIALYWVLLESVELRQAPWILWIDNLSAPDPYFVLPLIMGVSMYVQQKLNPAPPDPMQAKIMMSLPFVFTVFFAFFPSGLVLYWTVNNLLSITQQWHITRAIEKAAAKRRR